MSLLAAIAALLAPGALGLGGWWLLARVLPAQAMATVAAWVLGNVKWIVLAAALLAVFVAGWLVAHQSAELAQAKARLATANRELEAAAELDRRKSKIADRAAEAAAAHEAEIRVLQTRNDEYAAQLAAGMAREDELKRQQNESDNDYETRLKAVVRNGRAGCVWDRNGIERMRAIN